MPRKARIRNPLIKPIDVKHVNNNVPRHASQTDDGFDRADKITYEHRLAIVLDTLVFGYTGTRYQLLEAFQKQNPELWNISFKQFERYLKAANDKLHEKFVKDVDYYVNQGVQRYNKLLLKMQNAKDYRGCLLAQEKLEGLLQLGHFGKQEVDVNIRNIRVTLPARLRKDKNEDEDV